MASRDVTIRGAGIFGLSIAWALVARGARVAVIDPFGAGAGSSGGLVGALAPHVPENWNPKKAFQLDSLLMAEGFWQGVEAAGGVSSGYGRTGRLQPVMDERGLELARARALTAAELWQGQAVWEVVEDDRFGISPTRWVIHDTLTARMHPRRACAALVAALAARGVMVQAEGGDTGQVVHACGWRGLQALSEALGKPVGTGIKGQSAAFRLDAPTMPQLFVDGLHIVPHSDGTVAIGSTTERDFTDPAFCDAQCDDLIARARAAWPALEGAEVVDRWAGARPRAKSRAPMLGFWPGRPGHFVANGGFKIGFGMAPKVSEVIADLLLDGVDRIPEGFRVEDSL